MVLSNFFRKRPQSQPENQETFILETILTPSALVDDGNDTPDLVLVNPPDDLLDEVDIGENQDVLADSLPELDIADEDIEDIAFITVNEVAAPGFDSGVFTVGDTGEVSIDFLFDGGKYQGELAIFSLEGMPDYDSDPEGFISEAASRALSDSELGYVVISDSDEGAKFSGELGERDRNSGDYLGVKSFQMNPGDEFGFMLVPKGTVEEVFDNPAIGGAKRPLFSMATANPDDAFHVGQLADVTGDGNTFVIEDLRVDGKSDGDYNDLIFQVKGATGTGEEVLIDDVIADGKDWRDTEVGQELIDYTIESIKPTVTISATDADATESGNPGEFVVTRTGDTDTELTVNYTVVGTATNGDDYSTLTGTVVIPEGSNTVTIPINVVDDAEIEGEETVTINLLEDSTYKLDETTSDTVNIIDNDEIPIIDNDEITIDVSEIPGFELLDKPLEVADGVWFVGTGPSPDQLRILTPFNIDAADTINTDQLQPGGDLGLNLDGDGITVGVWDGGHIRSTHQEFGNRVVFGDSSAGLSNHATHVGGTIGATGVDPRALGMANQVNLRSYDWNNDIAEIGASASLIDLSNHSYGRIAGWTRRFNWNIGNFDAWFEDRSQFSIEGATFGKYDSNVRSLDQVLYDNPDLLSVWAAGNDRNDEFTNALGDNRYMTYLSSPVQGIPFVGSGYYLVSTDVLPAPPSDGNGGSGYDTLSPAQVAKNTLVVGAIEDITADPYEKNDVSITSFSSWGPTDDGRIKPDVVANGSGLISSGANSDNHYYSNSGTSMAAPSVTGTAALLIEHYQNLFNDSPRSATTKGLLIHTAFDAGNVGPDYIHGWGVVDAAAAATFLTSASSNTDSSNWLTEGTYSRTKQTIEVESDGTKPLKATIAWTDPPGNSQGSGLDVDTSVLVNDLELRITGPDGTTYYPWTLDPDNPANPAVRNKANSLDNVEQVLIDAPVAGKYQIHIDRKGSSFEQDYSLLVSGAKNSTKLVDLSGLSFDVVQEPRNTGQSFTTKFKIQNSQADSSGSFDVDFYLSKNSTISTADRYLGSYRVSNVLGNSSTGTLLKSLRLPSWEDPFWDGNVNGTNFHIGMIVDADNEVVEINESNNRNNGFLKSYDNLRVNNILVGAWSANGNFDNFKQQIRDRWNQGYELIGVDGHNGGWFGIFGQAQRPNAYYYASRLSTFEQQIQDQWDAGLNLIDVEYGDGRWLGVFGRDSGRNAWSYSSNFNNFRQQIEDRWDQGYELVDVGYGDGRWFGVFADTPRPNAYSFDNNFDNFKQRIRDRWDQGLDLIDVEYGDGRWFGIFGPDDGRNAYSSANNFDDFRQRIEDRWDQGYELVDVTYGDGRWFGVFQD